METRAILSLLARFERVTVECEKAIVDIDALKSHVETLREASKSAAHEMIRLRAERDALAGQVSGDQNIGALLDLYHARMIESKEREKLALERVAEKDAAYGKALAELDEERAEAERWRNAHHKASIWFKTHDCGEWPLELYERASRAEELAAKLGAELDEERENVRTLKTHVETLREALEKPSKEKRDG